MIAFAGFALVAATLFCVWLTPRKYKIGMTFDEVQQSAEIVFDKITVGREYIGTPTTSEMEHDAAYEVVDEESGVVLRFNHRDRLVEIQRFKWAGGNFARLLRSVRSFFD